jgi:multiple antibiotic resistance protein
MPAGMQPKFELPGAGAECPTPQSERVRDVSRNSWKEISGDKPIIRTSVMNAVYGIAMFGPARVALNTLHSSYVTFLLVALSSIFFLVDPFAAIGTFLAITADVDAKRRKLLARKASITCFVVLTTFALVGKFIFRMFGITLPAFEIAGGLILLLIGLDMLQAKRSPTQEASSDTEEAAVKEDVGIVPLGIPMLAGPGAISSVMVLVGQAGQLWEVLIILGVIAFTAYISYLVLAGAGRVRQVMGETGIRILVRIMGLLLVALAVQFFVNGLTDLGVIAKQIVE